VVHNVQPVAVYARRFAGLCFALLGAAFLLVATLMYFAWPTPSITNRPWIYLEPDKTLIFAGSLLLFGSILVVGLYWTFRRSPMLYLDTTGLVYRLYPLMQKSFRWADIAGITAMKQTPTSPALASFNMIVGVTLFVHVKPRAVAQYHGKSRHRLGFGRLLLPMPMDELVYLVQHYHPIHEGEL